MAWAWRNVRLTEAAAERWERFCTRSGVTMTAMIEALGESDPGEWIPEQAITRAREIDRERRSRRG